MKTKFGLQAIRRVNDTGHHYFISSLQNKGVDGWITLGTNAAAAALFNPMTGECGEAKVRQANGKTQVYLQLKSGESIILQTYQQPCRHPNRGSMSKSNLSVFVWIMVGSYTSPKANRKFKGHLI